MNLNILEIEVMVSHSKTWLSSERIMRELLRNDLCAAITKRVKAAHGSLSALSNRRDEIKRLVSKLKKRSKKTDIRHDRKARAVDAVVLAIILGSEDPELAELCAELRSLLLPDGIGIVQRSYLFQSGAVAAMQERIKPDHLALMDQIKIGRNETLLQWYTQWVEAGELLGRDTHERMALEKQSSRTGSSGQQVDGNVARNAWISAVQKLLSALAEEPIADDVRDAIIGPLEKSVQAALAGRPDPFQDESPDDAATEAVQGEAEEVKEAGDSELTNDAAQAGDSELTNDAAQADGRDEPSTGSAHTPA